MKIALTLLACGTVALTVACGDGGSTAPTATAQETPQATERQTPSAGRTGVTEVDAFIDAMAADHGKKETPALSALIGFTKVACSATPEQGIGGPPACQLNEKDGELVDVFPTASCEGADLRPYEMDQVLMGLAESQLYAVYRAPPGTRYDADYAAIVYRTIEGTGDAASEALLAGGKIVGYFFSCVLSPAELVTQRGYTEAVLPPQTP